MTDNNDEYVLEDNDVESSSSSDNYVLDEDSGELKPDLSPDSDLDDKPGKRPSPMRIMFTLLTNPIEGCKALRRSKYKDEEIAARCFYPMIALASASVFSVWIYGNAESVSEVVVKGLIVFVSFFLGNYVAHLLQQWLLPKSAQEFVKSAFGTQLTMLCISTLALFAAVESWIPLLQPVFFFLPLWTVYAIVRSGRFIRCDQDKHTLVITLLCVIIVGAPILVTWVADFILP